MGDAASQSKVVYLSFGLHDGEDVAAAIPYQVHLVGSLRELVRYFLENTDTIGLVAELGADLSLAVRAVDIAHRLNPQIPVVCLGDAASFNRIGRPKSGAQPVHAADLKALLSILKPKATHRKFCRLEWPLPVYYSRAFNMAGSQGGKLVNLSIGGAAVYTPGPSGFKLGDAAFLKILFESFAFFVECRVARAELPGHAYGFAVEFQKISPATRGAIQDILGDKLVQVLFDDFEIAEPASRTRAPRR
ncbi:MAG: PilZ domain-containing protein [Spirochaetes bacterium]|nr:PilZ domain-containing protein [Spirochaetota bacterium]